MLSRDKAIDLVRRHVRRENLFKHILAVEAIMRSCAREVGHDEELWGLAGLLHDLDFEETGDNMEFHGLRSVEIIEEEAEGEVPQEVVRAIKAHNSEGSGVNPGSDMDFALLAADAVSGLIVAATLGLPSKKLVDLSVKNVARRFRERDFAKNCDREKMILCEKAGLQLDMFLDVSLRALQEVSGQLGL